MPKRIRMSRKKGWRKPAGAVYVGRPSRWGNIYAIGSTHADADGNPVQVRDAVHAVALFRDWVTPHQGLIEEALRGKDLACWCRPGEPCHADVLLELANPSEKEGPAGEGGGAESVRTRGRRP